jgi:hypothetical protein
VKGRTLTSFATAVLVTMLASTTPALSHHGFTGRYDRSHPLYIEGQITQATYQLPHGLITIEPSQPAGPPPDLLALPSGAYVRLGGRDVVTRSRPIEPVGGGVLVLLLTPPMTTEVQARPAPPSRGQPIGAIVFRECSTGELRVQLLRVSATDTLVRAGVLQTEVDGCNTAAATSSPSFSTPSAVAIATNAGSEPVAVETKGRTDTAGALLLLAAAAAAGIAALVVGVLISRRSIR